MIYRLDLIKCIRRWPAATCAELSGRCVASRPPQYKKPHSLRYYWEEEQKELMPLPSVPYEYMERRIAKVSSDFHIRYDNAYYSVEKAYLYKEVLIRASATMANCGAFCTARENSFFCHL